MPAHVLSPSEALPRSHYFVTLSRGSGMRTVALRAPLVHLAALLLPALLLAGLCSTLYLAFHDDLVAGLMRRESAMQYAYEDRIEALPRIWSGRPSAAAPTGRSSTPGCTTCSPAKPRSKAAPPPWRASPPPCRLRPPRPAPGDHRPHPGPARFGAGLRPAGQAPARGRAAARGPADRARQEDHASLLDDARVPVGDRLGAVGLSLDRVGRGQLDALSRIGGEAQARSARIRGLIETAGLSPERYLPKPAAGGVGGPFVPLPEGPDGAFDRAVAEMRGAVAAAGQLGGRAAPAAPGRAPARPHRGDLPLRRPHRPVPGPPALHTGVDLREGYGTDIRATGAGRVAFAGTAGGYGNMVEVDHGNGLSTRYAHMGGIAVAEGQAVSRGTVLGTVGRHGAGHRPPPPLRGPDRRRAGRPDALPGGRRPAGEPRRALTARPHSNATLRRNHRRDGNTTASRNFHPRA